MTVVIRNRLSTLPKGELPKGKLVFGGDEEGGSGGKWPTLKMAVFLSCCRPGPRFCILALTRLLPSG